MTGFLMMKLLDETEDKMVAIGSRYAPDSRALLVGLILLLMMCCLTAGSALAQGQGQDTSAPVIEIQEFDNAVADRRQVFTVSIEEDGQLQSATLYYRRSGELTYAPVAMQAVGDSGFYSATIDTDFLDLRTIEYYVLAVDAAGNRTLGGFAFDPYRRTLREGPSPLSPEPVAPAVVEESVPAADPTSVPILQRRWVQVTLGILAVGAIASLVGDDDGDDTRIVPLTFNLQ